MRAFAPFLIAAPATAAALAFVASAADTPPRTTATSVRVPLQAGWG